MDTTLLPFALGWNCDKETPLRVTVRRMSVEMEQRSLGGALIWSILLLVFDILKTLTGAKIQRII